MRIKIVADSMKTEPLRELLAALASIGLHQTAQVGVNGPECWTVETPFLTPSQHALVFSRLIKLDGKPLLGLVREPTDAA